MRVICIDDEQLALDYLTAQLKKIDKIDVIGAYNNPIQAYEEVISQQVDLIMVDIQMPQMNGLEFAERILEEKPDLQIVFITAHSQYAVEAFQLNALDYVVKPITLGRLQKTISRIDNNMESSNFLAVPLSSTFKIKVASTLMFELEPDSFKPLSWRTTRTQELFLYLLQNGNKLVDKSSIVELLWNEYNLEKAYALLYTTIYNIRKQLKQYQKHLTLKNQSNGYILELHQVEIDLVKWEEELSKLPNINSRSVTEYEEVMCLNKGSYLSNYDYIWLEAERHRLDHLWIKTALQMAIFYVEIGDNLAAMRWYRAILEREPLMEEVHFQLMKLYQSNGDFTLMMQQYQELCKILRSEAEAMPSDYIVQWYKEKMK